MNTRPSPPLVTPVQAHPTAASRLPAVRWPVSRLPVAVLSLLALLVLLFITLSPRLAPDPTAIWRQKPVLGYFFLTQSLASEIENQDVLTGQQLWIARQIARLQSGQLEHLEQESLTVVADPSLTLAEKRMRIREMGYNRRVQAAITRANSLLALLLPARDYASLTAWAEERWILERNLHGLGSMPPAAEQASARSYKIFATRYNSGDRYAVALPDKCLKFSNAGNRLCADDGYQINQGYFVYLSYDGETAAEVWESGPWNVDDNYWSTSSDPQPRRMYTDLPAGMPEAQAAFFDGYNGGVDQYGRVVTAPFGIDLGRQVSIDIGLMPGNNDWINITYAWTEGWDKAKKPRDTSSGQPANQGSSATSAPAVSPLVTATPNPDGSLVHVVQPGQALWSVAIAYGVTLQEIYTLNGLSEGAIIRPGDQLVIIAAQPTPTSTLTVASTSTLPPTPTRKPSATPQPATLTPTPSETPELQAASPRSDPLLLLIAGGAVLGALLLLAGAVLRRK